MFECQVDAKQASAYSLMIIYFIYYYRQYITCGIFLLIILLFNYQITLWGRNYYLIEKETEASKIECSE